MTRADRIAIGDRIDRRCGELDLTRTEFMRLTGTNYRRMQSWFDGEYSPSATSIVRICAVLKMSADELLGIDRLEMPEPRFREGVEHGA